jgi:triacylglycerol lipase
LPVRANHAWVFAALVLAGCGSSGDWTTATSAPDPVGSSPPAASSTPVSSASPVVPTPTRTPRTPDPSVPASSADQPPFPIVLLHGMAGFGQLNGPVPITYFNGVVAYLASIGETDVFVTVAAPYDTSEVRAAQIAPQIEAILAQTGKSKVNLVGHSQGGMDARILASPNGLAMGDHIASVTTIATPHGGTPVADLVVAAAKGTSDAAFDAVTTAFLGLLQATVYDVQTTPALLAQMQEMSTGYMTSTFNLKYIDDPQVPYSSYAGRTNLESGAADCADAVYADDSTSLDSAQAILLPTAQYVQGVTDVTNDGLVPAASARWGTFLQCIPADHMNQVGWFESGTDPLSGYNHLTFFQNVVARIRAAGF